MKKYLLLSAVILSLSFSAYGQLHREAPFGLDLPFYRWSREMETRNFNFAAYDRLTAPTDAANIRFAVENDSTDIILIADRGNSRIYWLRCSADPSLRSLDYRSFFGDFGVEIREFRSPSSVEAASVSNVYDPDADHIYVADKMNNRLVKLNFQFHPDSPELDQIIWESSVFIDSEFFPADLEYVNYGTGNLADNNLLALDFMGGRIAEFSHEGALTEVFDLQNAGDTSATIYSGMTHNVRPDGSVVLYVADIGNSRICALLYNMHSLTFIAEMDLATFENSQVTNVVYDQRIGLWAVESNGPHLYKLSLDLSRIIREIGPELLDRVEIDYPIAIIPFSERLIIIEEMSETTGILSFAFQQPSGKRDVRDEEIIPFTFALNQNYPNPFNPSTTVGFEIPSTQWVTLEIFNILGQKVTVLLDEKMAAGRYSLIWDGTNSAGRYVSSGVYFSRLSAGDNTEVKKMLMLK